MLKHFNDKKCKSRNSWKDFLRMWHFLYWSLCAALTRITLCRSGSRWRTCKMIVSFLSVFRKISSSSSHHCILGCFFQPGNAATTSVLFCNWNIVLTSWLTLPDQLEFSVLSLCLNQILQTCRRPSQRGLCLISSHEIAGERFTMIQSERSVHSPARRSLWCVGWWRCRWLTECNGCGLLSAASINTSSLSEVLLLLTGDHFYFLPSLN